MRCRSQQPDDARLAYKIIIEALNRYLHEGTWKITLLGLRHLHDIYSRKSSEREALPCLITGWNLVYYQKYESRKMITLTA